MKKTKRQHGDIETEQSQNESSMKHRTFLLMNAILVVFNIASGTYDTIHTNLNFAYRVIAIKYACIMLQTIICALFEKKFQGSLKYSNGISQSILLVLFYSVTMFSQTDEKPEHLEFRVILSDFLFHICAY